MLPFRTVDRHIMEQERKLPGVSGRVLRTFTRHRPRRQDDHKGSEKSWTYRYIRHNTGDQYSG